MQKIILSFGFLSVIFPVIAGATYTRTPSGTVTSTKFSFADTNPAVDFSGWSGSGNSWSYAFMTLGSSTFHYLNPPCFNNSNGYATSVQAVNIPAPTGSQIVMVDYAQWTSSNCTTGALNNDRIEGIYLSSTSLFEFNEISTSSPTSTISTSTCYTGLCMFSTSTDAALGNIFKMSEILITFGLVLLIGSIVYKFLNRNKK